MIQHIINNLGGIANIDKVGNCMTRLRVAVHDPLKVSKERLLKGKSVFAVIINDKEIQIVQGPGIAESSAREIKKIKASSSYPDPALPLDTKTHTRKKHAAQIFLAKFATIFTPLIPGFIAAGLLLGLATLGEQIVGQSHFFDFVKVFGKGLFAFLGVLVGYNAASAFGGSGVIGAILGALFVLSYNPDSGSYYAGIETFFALPVDPRGGIIGILIAAIASAKVEKHVRLYITPSLDMLVTGTLTLIVMGALVYTVIMPIGHFLFQGMSWLFINLNQSPFGTALLSGVFLVAVMLGIHQGFIPVYFALIEAQGFNSLFPVLAMAGGGLVGASLALYCKGDKELRTQIRGAIIPGFLGVAEPLIYGVCLPRVRPFVLACLGGAAGGFFVGTASSMGMPMGLNSVFGPSGLVATPLITSPHGVIAGMAIYLLGLLVSYCSGFALTFFFSKK